MRELGSARAADGARPRDRRRGPRRGGPGDAAGDEPGQRRLAVHAPRRQLGRGAHQDRHLRPHGARAHADRGHQPARSPSRSASSSTLPGVRTGTAWCRRSGRSRAPTGGWSPATRCTARARRRARLAHAFTTRTWERLMANGLDPTSSTRRCGARRCGHDHARRRACSGRIVGLGLLLVVAGVRGVPAGPAARPAAARWRRVEQLNRRVGLALGCGGRGVRDHPLAGRCAGRSGLRDSPRRRCSAPRRGAGSEVDRIEAVARWAEQLRDTMSAAAGLHEAIGVTARVAPLPIRDEVQELAARVAPRTAAAAMRRFAARLASPPGTRLQLRCSWRRSATAPACRRC